MKNQENVWSAFYAFQGVAVDALVGEVTMEVFRGSIERFINETFDFALNTILNGIRDLQGGTVQ